MFIIAAESYEWEDNTMTLAGTLRSQNPFFDPATFADPAFDVRPQYMRVRRIGFLVYPDIEVIDLCGPWDVFSYADRWTRIRGSAEELGYEVLVIADKPGPITTMSGIQITATHGLDEVVDNLDTLVIVGGIGVARACEETTLVEWVKMMAPRSRRVASVCSGAYLPCYRRSVEQPPCYNALGIFEHLAATYPSLRVEPNLIYVRDGNVYTSGGITSGIDLALAMIEEDLGREIPRLVAGFMVVFLRRPGGQTQFSPFLQAEAKAV
jgi:transcriptional regulator GlxA family with amidase domain